MTNGHKLLGPGGHPLATEPGLIVIKTPKGVQIPPQVAGNLSKITGCNVIVLPMDSEIMMGRLARQELDSVHQAIHAILDIPADKLT